MTSRLRLLLNLAGAIVLLAGYTGAVLVWRAQDRLEQPDAAAAEAAPLPLLDSRRDSQQVELNFGKSGLLIERALEWLESLTHGRRLAKTLIVLSSAAAIGCFVAAGRRKD